MREVLLVTKIGEVFSDVPESDKIRHDTVAASLIYRYIDTNYRETPAAKSMYDNCLNAAKFYQILAIMDDVNALVAFFPDVISPKQIIYFIENFGEEAEEKQNSKRFHLVKYDAASNKLRDINMNILLDIYTKTMGEKQNGFNR